jgi:hypothetical protein
MPAKNKNDSILLNKIAKLILNIGLMSVPGMLCDVEEYALRCVLTTRISGAEILVPEATQFLRRNS